jgi:hypothetical protein
MSKHHSSMRDIKWSPGCHNKQQTMIAYTFNKHCLHALSAALQLRSRARQQQQQLCMQSWC